MASAILFYNLIKMQFKARRKLRTNVVTAFVNLEMQKSCLVVHTTIIKQMTKAFKTLTKVARGRWEVWI